MNDVMIEANGLTKKYGNVTAVDDVSFQVRKGEIVGFLGPNGAGKTTTMKMLTCFIAPTEGSAQVNGSDVFTDPMGVRRSLGYLPETTPLYKDMTVLEYLEFVGRMRGFGGDELRPRIRAAVENTGLVDVIGKEIRALSKGYRQRVGLAQAILHTPEILILDEPMSGLDPNQAAEIRNLISEIGKERTVILSTHDLGEVAKTCNRIFIIAKGTLVADSTPDELAGGKEAGALFQAKVLADGDREAVRARARDAFAQIRNVEAVRAGGASNGELEFLIAAKGQQDLRADIFRAAVEGGLVLVGLQPGTKDLGEVFKELTMQEAVATKRRAKADHEEEEEEEEEDEAEEEDEEEDDEDEREKE